MASQPSALSSCQLVWSSTPSATTRRLPHTLLVRVATAVGLFQVGSAQAEALASVEEGGDTFPGTELRTVHIVQA